MKALGPKSGGPTSGVGPKLGGPARGWVQNQGVLLEGGSTIGGSHFKGGSMMEGVTDFLYYRWLSKYIFLGTEVLQSKYYY